MPLEQIKYDPVIVNERLKKIKKRRTIINSGLTAISFVLIGVAVVLLILLFLNGSGVNLDKNRIFKNLQSLYIRNGKTMASHSKINLLSLKETAVITYTSLIVPNLLLLETGMRKFVNRMSINIILDKSIKRLWDCIVNNCEAIENGFRQIVSRLKNIFSLVSHGFYEMLTQVKEKIEQITNNIFERKRICFTIHL